MQVRHARPRAIPAPLAAALVLACTGGLAVGVLSPAFAEGTPPPSSPPATPAPVAPGAPTAVTAVAGDTRATVSWLPGTPGEPASPVTFTVFARVPGASAAKVACEPVNDVAGGRKQCVATGLTNGSTYTFTVEANNGLASPSSAPSNAVVPAGKPGAPSILKAVPGDTQVTVTWKAAPANGAKVTLYRVYTSGSRATCSTTGALTCSVTGLVNGKAYKFRVAALNAKGTGALSAWSAAVVPALPPATKLPIKFGQKGPLVVALQQRLGWAGLPVRVNGYFDATTQAMVKRFQGKFFLDQTGVVGSSTWVKLVSLTRGNGALPAACRTGTVICVQKSLKLVRYLVNGVPKLILDARFGSESTPTRNGMHYVFSKDATHVSTEFHTSMPFSMFFDGGQALHYSKYFAADGYYGASHGCVNLRDYDGARRLFNMTAYGTPVYITS